MTYSMGLGEGGGGPAGHVVLAQSHDVLIGSVGTAVTAR